MISSYAAREQLSFPKMTFTEFIEFRESRENPKVDIFP